MQFKIISNLHISSYLSDIINRYYCGYVAIFVAVMDRFAHNLISHMKWSIQQQQNIIIKYILLAVDYLVGKDVIDSGN